MSPLRRFKVWKVRWKCIRASRLKTPDDILQKRSETYKKYTQAGIDGKKKDQAYYQGMLDESAWILKQVMK